MLNVKDNFESYSFACKIFEEGKTSSELHEENVSFSAESIELKDLHNVEIINDEMNKISRKIFRYSVLLETQTHVVQLLEDEFGYWQAAKYMEVTSNNADAKKALTESQKDNIIKTTWLNDYQDFKHKIQTEKYKLGLLKRTVSALEGYSYKLHDLQEYRKSAMMKGL